MLLATVLFGCKKEDDFTSPDQNTTTNNTNNPPPATDVFAQNEALIKPGAQVYLICDVEGFDRLEKINIQMVNMNYQSADNTCSYGYGNGWCSAGYYEYQSGCENTNHEIGTDLKVEIGIRGKCPDCTFEDLVKPGVQLMRGTDNQSIGADVYFRYMLEDLFYSSKAASGDNFMEVISVEKRNTEWGSHFIKVHFSCKLITSDGDVIHLKNGVFRSVIDDKGPDE